MPLPVVFVIDDDELVLAALTRELRGEPIRLVALGSTAAARHALREHVPSLVLCDLHLPGGGGEQVLREIRGRLPTTRTVIITGAGPEESGLVLAQGLADAVLEKPWRREELLRLVRLSVGIGEGRELSRAGAGS